MSKTGDVVKNIFTFASNRFFLLLIRLDFATLVGSAFGLQKGLFPILIGSCLSQTKSYGLQGAGGPAKGEED